MDSLAKHETCITGKLILQDGKPKFDENTERIGFLTKNVLTQLAVDDSGWATLYYDKQHRNYWEMTYPQSHLHGGGPPQLKKITDPNRIKDVYGLDL